MPIFQEWGWRGRFSCHPTHTLTHTITHSRTVTHSHTIIHMVTHSQSPVVGAEAQKQTRPAPHSGSVGSVLNVGGRVAQVCSRQPGGALCTHSLALAIRARKACGWAEVLACALSLPLVSPSHSLFPQRSPLSFAAFAGPRAPFREPPLGPLNRCVWVCVRSPGAQRHPGHLHTQACTEPMTRRSARFAVAQVWSFGIGSERVSQLWVSRSELCAYVEGTLGRLKARRKLNSHPLTHEEALGRKCPAHWPCSLASQAVWSGT